MDINLDIIMQIVLLIAVIVTCATLVVMLAKLRELLKELSDIRVTLAEAFKHLDKPLSDALAEDRRNNRLLSELLALKQAEMTGDFEIVEEPVIPTPTLKEPKVKNHAAKGAEAKLTPPPQSFPKIG